MNRTFVTAACIAALSGCATQQSRGPDAAHGFETAGIGLSHLVLAPVMIAAGLLEGIAALPVFLASGVHDLNEGLRTANAAVTLDDTYRGAYGRPLAEVPASGDTGTVFHEMRSATMHFQSMLRRQGVADADRYVLTAVRTADRDGYTLYAVVRRAQPLVQVADRDRPGRVHRLDPVDLDFYRPYPTDANGAPVDEIVDWAGLPRSAIATQKGQAILMNLAANSILNGRRAGDYWAVEQRWIAGEFRTIADARQAALRARMGIV
jgi:hypothetical protein